MEIAEKHYDRVCFYIEVKRNQIHVSFDALGIN